MRTGIRARFVVGHDGRDHVVYERGELVYENDRVLFVGHGYPEPVDRAVEYGDAVVSPGFVDLDALADIDRGAEPPSKLLVGAIDNHVHAGPVRKASPSCADPFRVVEEAREAGMRGRPLRRVRDQIGHGARRRSPTDR